MHTYKAAVLASLVFSTFAGAATPATPPSGSPPSQPGSASEEPCQALLRSAETLYQQQQFESAAVVVKQGLASCRGSPETLARLYVLDGILALESLAELDARADFAAGLSSDTATKFPEYASPRARRLFDAVKAEQALVAAKVEDQKKLESAPTIAAAPAPTAPQTAPSTPSPPNPPPSAQKTVAIPSRTAPTPSLQQGRFGNLPLISAGVATSAAVLTGVFMGLGAGQTALLQGGTLQTGASLEGAVTFGRAMNVAAYASLGVAVVAAGVGVTLWSLDGPGPHVSLGVVPGRGAYAVVRGEY